MGIVLVVVCCSPPCCLYFPCASDLKRAPPHRSDRDRKQNASLEPNHRQRNGSTEACYHRGRYGLIPSTLSSSEPAATPTNDRGIGAHTPLLQTTESRAVSTETLPTSFGASRAQRAFVRAAPAQTPPVPKADLSAEERAHFAKISGSFGAKRMAKMGWSAVRPFTLHKILD